ncbi:MAG: IPTL-CTERM sorting domain-containing protein [Thiolinea sp.]
MQIDMQSELLLPYRLTTSAATLSVNLQPGQDYSEADFGLVLRPIPPAEQVMIPTLSEWAMLLLGLLMLLLAGREMRRAGCG